MSWGKRFYLHKLVWLAVESLAQRPVRTAFLILTVAVGAGATMFLFAFYVGLEKAIHDNLLKGLPEKQLVVEIEGVAESFISGQLTSQFTLGAGGGSTRGIRDQDLAQFKKLHGLEQLVPRPLLPYPIRWRIDFDKMGALGLAVKLLIPERDRERAAPPTLFYGVDRSKALAEIYAARKGAILMEDGEVPVFVSRELIQGAKDATQVRLGELNLRERKALGYVDQLFFNKDSQGVPIQCMIYRGNQRKFVAGRIVGFYSGAPLMGLSIPHETVLQWHAWHNEGKPKPDPLVYNSVVLDFRSADDMLAGAEAIHKLGGLKVSGQLVTAQKLTNLRKILPPATLLVGSLLFFLAAGGIVVGLSLSVAEQTRRIGILRAVGARQVDILFLFLCEAAIVGVLGVALGSGLQVGGVRVVDPIVRNTIPGVADIQSMFYPSSDFNLMVAVVGVMVALLAGLVPAFTATLIRPSEVLKV